MPDRAMLVELEPATEAALAKAMVLAMVATHPLVMAMEMVTEAPTEIRDLAAKAMLETAPPLIPKP